MNKNKKKIKLERKNDKDSELPHMPPVIFPEILFNKILGLLVLVLTVILLNVRTVGA